MDTATKPPIFPVTGAQLHDIFGGTSASRCEEVAKLINKYSTEYGIDNAEKMSHFVGQIGAESDLVNLKEFYKYLSKDRIIEIFGKVRLSGKVKYCDLFVGYSANLNECDGDKPFPCNPSLIVLTNNLIVKDKYVNSKLLFDYTYSCKMDNGPTITGDGSRFRGRGFMHLTGRDKYTALQTNWNKTFLTNQKDFLCDSGTCEDNRDLLETDLDFSMKASLSFWKSVHANDSANTVTDASILQVSLKVNGGDNGIIIRKKITNKSYNIFKK